MAELYENNINEQGLSPGYVTALQRPFVSDGAGTPEPAVTTAEAREQAEIKRLRATHSDYADRKDFWLFLLKSYEGGPAYVDEDTLHKHQRENRLDYEDRLKRAYFLNYCQPLVDFVPEFIFSQGVERKADPTLVVEFEKFKHNCDRAGTTLDVFMQQLAEDARIYGMTFVMVDKLPPPVEQDPEAVSVQRASELGIDLPYMVKVNPLEVLDWRIDQTGNYIFLKRRECMSYYDYTTGDYVDAERYSEWYPTHKQISVVDVTDPKKPAILSQADTPNTWQEIPFIPVIYKRSKANNDLGMSFLQDIAFQNRQIFNLTSLLDEFLFRQCFNVLVMETSSMVPRKEQVDGNIGNSNVLEVPAATKLKPEYLSPPVAPAEFLQAERQHIAEEMYRIAAQDLMSEVYTGTGRSGDAIKQAFSRTIPVIAKTADMLQQSERRIFGLWAKMLGKNWSSGKISYRDDYSVTNLQDLILQLTSIFNSIHILSPTFVREEWKRIIHEFDGKIDADTMAKIIEEITAVSDQAIVNIIVPPVVPPDQQAGFGVPSTANLTQGKTQAGKTDKQISLGTGSKAATKEAAPDANKRATGGRSTKK